MAKGPKRTSSTTRQRNQKAGAGILAFGASVGTPLLPTWWGLPIALAGAILWLYSLSSVEKFVASSLKSRPISAAAFGLLILGLFMWPLVGAYSRYQKALVVSPLPALATAPTYPPTDISIPTPTRSGDSPCSAGTGLKFNNITSKSNLPATAHTYGVFIKGDPCATFDGVNNENMTEGVHIEPDSSQPTRSTKH